MKSDNNYVLKMENFLFFWFLPKVHLILTRKAMECSYIFWHGCIFLAFFAFSTCLCTFEVLTHLQDPVFWEVWFRPPGSQLSFPPGPDLLTDLSGLYDITGQSQEERSLSRTHLFWTHQNTVLVHFFSIFPAIWPSLQAYADCKIGLSNFSLPCYGKTQMYIF